jgi:flavin-dependent dehydrogenase
LTRVLAEVAAESGATLHWSCRVGELARHAGGLRLETTAGPLEASLLVAADGLHSRLRQGAGLAGRAARRRRFGMRRHYRIRPWTDAVEVHLAPGKEAFLTPVGPELVGLAVLWERGGKPLGTGPGVDFAALLASFPQVAERLAGAAVDGKPRGAGPLDQRVVSPVADRIALVGDAAGYLDAITGEGLSLAFESAAALAAIAPRALTSGASRAALRPYARAHARHYRRYALVARVVLSVARRPRLRRKLVRWLGQRPGQLERWIRWGIG